MSDSIRIKTSYGDKYLNVNINRDFDFLNTLSLKISQSDIYSLQESSYGVLIGRILLNNGVGCPNAHVSLFLALDDTDASDSVISSIYPYDLISTKDSDGYRYNLLNSSEVTCEQRAGNFPSKRMFIDNPDLLYTYQKYLKFTCTTNQSGDYCFVGIPKGTNYKVHIDVDISNIGVWSQRPYDLVREGICSKDKFKSMVNFDTNSNLDSLPQVFSYDSSVSVASFWGDSQLSQDVYISRFDFNIPFTLVPAAIMAFSVISDDHKHSINKYCRARRNMGNICKMIAAPGTVEILYYGDSAPKDTFDINSDGVFVGQIEMNESAMVTDEYGNLILSEDPTKGIFTECRVRLRISTDSTGEEGRLRRRADSLVPNNPIDGSEGDYTFDEHTSLDYFYKLRFGNIYTVRNFISRIQKQFTIQNTFSARDFLGIKRTSEECSIMSFPFNRINLNDSLMFLFSILCLFTSLLIDMDYLINTAIVNSINAVFSGIEHFLNNIINIDVLGSHPLRWIGNINLGRVPCIKINCYGQDYYPGCNSSAWGSCPPPCDTSKSDTTTCFNQQLVDFLDMVKFDFYNDWINGTIYQYLIKYKSKRKNIEKFCNYDDTNYSNNAVDTSSVITMNTSQNIREGLIKEVTDIYGVTRLYYAAHCKLEPIKLFSTDITNLGSISKCNIYGYPQIYNYLQNSTFKYPPDIADGNVNGIQIELFDIQIPNQGTTVVGGDRGLLYNFGGLKVAPCTIYQDWKNMKNTTELCEIGMDEDETKFNINNILINTPDSCLDSNDIDNEFIRKSLRILNNHSGIDDLNIFRGFNSSCTIGGGDSWSTSCYNSPNGQEFNGDTFLNSSSFKGLPWNNSYYFYFGLTHGRDALSVLRNDYLPKCNINNNNNTFQLLYSATSVNNIALDNGTITINILDGVPPFDFRWIGPNGYNQSTVNYNSYIYNLQNLVSGTYTYTIIDNTQRIVQKSITIMSPPPITFNLTMIPATFTSVSGLVGDGQLIISNIQGGLNQYSYVVNISSNVTYVQQANIFSSGCTFNGLPQSLFVVNVVDIAGESSQQSVFLTCPNLLQLNVNTINPTTLGLTDGEIFYNIVGGVPPINASVITPSSDVIINQILSANTIFTIFNASAGTYSATFIDNNTPPQQLNNYLGLYNV